MQLQGNQGSFLKLHANAGSTKAATKFDCGGSTDDGRKGEGGAITASLQNQMMKLPQMNSTYYCGGSTDDGRKGEGGAITASRQNQMMILPQMNSTHAAR